LAVDAGDVDIAGSDAKCLAVGVCYCVVEGILRLKRSQRRRCSKGRAVLLVKEHSRTSLSCVHFKSPNAIMWMAGAAGSIALVDFVLQQQQQQVQQVQLTMKPFSVLRCPALYAYQTAAYCLSYWHLLAKKNLVCRHNNTVSVTI
jgi:hypothetical protein